MMRQRRSPLPTKSELRYAEERDKKQKRYESNMRRIEKEKIARQKAIDKELRKTIQSAKPKSARKKRFKTYTFSAKVQTVRDEYKK